jgi:predicted Zn-dependent protease with MMP-like domain
MDRDKFERLAREALESLPHRFKKYIDNVAIMVEDDSGPAARGRARTPRGGMLLGIYHGVPFQHRGPYYGNLPPDVIVLYQRPIESLGGGEEEIRRRVREVLLHEIGHYFGLSEEELRDIENAPPEDERS